MNARERIDAIEARVNAATGGEWKVDDNNLIYAQHSDDPKDYTVIAADVGMIDYGYSTEPIKPADAEFIAAAPTDIRYLLARVRELEAENAAIRANEDSAVKAYEQRVKRVWKLEEMLDETRTALTSFAAVGAQVAARPAYPPEQVVMRVGAASFTVADLIAAAAVVGVTAEAVTGGSVGTGISEIMEDAK